MSDYKIEQEVADYLRKRAAERAHEGVSIQLGYAVLIQDLSMGSDYGGPTQEMIELAEKAVGESLEKLFAARCSE